MKYRKNELYFLLEKSFFLGDYLSFVFHHLNCFNTSADKTKSHYGTDYFSPKLSCSVNQIFRDIKHKPCMFRYFQDFLEKHTSWINLLVVQNHTDPKY